MKEFLKKLLSAGAMSVVAAITVITAVGTMATVGVAKNVDSRITRIQGQIVESCELNEGMKTSLEPTVGLNDQAGTVGNYINEILGAMSGMRDGLEAMVATVGSTNGVLTDVRSHTVKLTAALNELVPFIEMLGGAVEEGNVASESALGVLGRINELNGAITAEMSQMRNKLANSMTYRALFTYAMPVLP